MKFIQTYQSSRSFLVFVLVVMASGTAMDALGQISRRTQRSMRSPELNVQFHRAETAWKSGNSLLEAKARIDRVIAALPDDSEARKLRAGIYLSMKDAANALVDARIAIRLIPSDGEAHLLVCEAASRTDNIELAKNALGIASELLLDRPDLHIRLSQCAVDLGLVDEAEAYARIALAADDTSAAAYLQLARVFVIARQIQKSVTVLEKGLKLGLVKPDQIRGDALFDELVQDNLLGSLGQDN